MENSASLTLGALAARAHDFLQEAGHPVSAEMLVEHVFGRIASPTTRSRASAAEFWLGQLARVLKDNAVFTQHLDGTWSLAEWGERDVPLEEMEYIVVDTETTGLDPTTQRVIEIGALRCRGPHVVARFNTLIDPQRSIPYTIQQLTGISSDMLRGAPQAPEAIRQFLDFCQGWLLVGHNARFDVNFLAAEALRHHQHRLLNPAVCTVRLAHLVLPQLKRRNLDAVAQALGLRYGDRHRAMADAELTQQAFWLMVEMARERGFATQGRLQAVAGLGRGVDGARNKRRQEGKALLDPSLRRGLPDKPGVYLMRDARGEVIYVGKAKNLKKRIASYYSQSQGYRRRKEGLLESVRELETRVVGSELEALILESRLIKEFLPRYNVQQRYYDGYSFIKVDVASPFPRVVATREVLADGARYFGPFRSRRVVETVVDLVQRLYPIRTCTRKIAADGRHRGRSAQPCFRYLVNRCLGPCMGGVSPERYGAVVEDVLAFLSGGSSGMLSRVEEEMFRAARLHDFERASRLRDTLRQAERLLLSQQLLTGAIEQNNLVIVCPSVQEGAVELFGIRHGRLFEQQQVGLTGEYDARADLLAFVQRLSAAAAAPPTVGKEEIDAIIIIGRWVARFAQSRQVVYLPDEPDARTVESLHAAAHHVFLTPPEASDEAEWDDSEPAEAAEERSYVIGGALHSRSWDTAAPQEEQEAPPFE